MARHTFPRSARAPERRAKGFSLLELLVSGIVILLLATVLNSLLTRYQGRAEQDMVDLTLRNLRISLRLHVATLMIEGRMKEVAKLDKSNPFVLLDQLPADYLGVVPEPPPAEVVGWYFDQGKGQLAFRPRSAGFPGGKGQELRWTVEFLPGQDAGARIKDEEPIRQNER